MGLDPVLKVRAAAELAARRRLAAAVKAAEDARRVAEEARALVMKAESAGGAAWLIEVHDVGHRRSVDALTRAEQDRARAESAADQVRGAHVEARMHLRVIERVVEERDLEARREAARKEQREQDERSAARFS